MKTAELVIFQPPDQTEKTQACNHENDLIVAQQARNHLAEQMDIE
jgi:hypothetical protein